MWVCLLSSDKNIQQSSLPTIVLEIKVFIYQFFLNFCTLFDIILFIFKEIDTCEDSLNDNLLSEILNKKLFPYFVKTKLYPKLVNYLFKINMAKTSNSEVYTIEMAIEDLLRKQFKAEAGALKMAVSGIPNSLKGFTEALLFKSF